MSDNTQPAPALNYVCYCDKVTEQDIEAAVLQGARTVKQVIQMTGAMTHCNCAVENPKGT